MKILISTLVFYSLSFQLACAENTRLPLSTNVDSLILCLNIEGEQTPGYYCEDIKVFNYSDVQSLQLAIDYNVDKIEWDTVINFNEDAKMTIFDTNLAEPGNFRISWGHPAGLSSFLDDEETLFTICYDVLENATSEDIYLSANISGGVEATNNDGVQIPISFSCGILNNTSIVPLSSTMLFPNPVYSELSIETDSNSSASVEIYDTYGRKILTAGYTSYDGDKSPITVEHLPSGTYILRFSQNNVITTHKFIKL